MIDANIPIKADNILRVERPIGQTVAFQTGTIVKAEVMDIIESGMVMLKITPPIGQSEGVEGKIIRAKSFVVLEKGDTVLLEANNDEEGLRFKVIERNVQHIESRSNETEGESFLEGIPKKFLEMLTNMSSLRLKSGDYQILKDMLNTMPALLKNNFPEFKALQSFLPAIEELNNKFFKRLVESSGVLFETRLKQLALYGKAFQGDDQKRLLMRLKEIVGSEQVSNILKFEGLKKSDIIDTIDRFIKNIEFYQLSSNINDMLYTYVPIIWNDMRDGQMIFKKEKKGDSNSFTCDIKLDLVSLGLIIATITWYKDEFYIYFNTQTSLTAGLLTMEKGELKKRFEAAGLNIKHINVIETKGLTFTNNEPHGLDVRV